VKRGEVAVDFFTFAGNGEPTLSPEYPGAVAYLLKLLGESDTRPGTAVFTNGSQLHMDSVSEATARLDRAILKIDIVTEATFGLKNRAGIDGTTLREIARSAVQLPNLYVQTAVAIRQGQICSEDELAYYCRLISVAKPIEIQLYNIVFPPAEAGICSASKAELQELAERLRKRLDVPIRTFDTQNTPGSD